MSNDRRESGRGSFARNSFIGDQASSISMKPTNSLGIEGFTEKDISDIVQSKDRLSVEEQRRIYESEIHQSFSPGK